MGVLITKIKVYTIGISHYKKYYTSSLSSFKACDN